MEWNDSQPLVSQWRLSAMQRDIDRLVDAGMVDEAHPIVIEARAEIHLAARVEPSDIEAAQKHFDVALQLLHCLIEHGR